MPPQHTPRRGFTLVEMLLVVTVIVVLIGMLLPALANSRESTRIAVCANNERQIYNALSEYSVANVRRFPYDTDTYNGNWMWDMTPDATNQMASYGGGKLDIFFCPSSSEQNAGVHWTFNVNYRVLGYFFTLKRHSGPMAGWAQFLTGKKWVKSFSDHYSHASQELVTDANLSSAGNFARIVGGSPIPHRSSHLGAASKPTGGNILFLDGHVDWRPFSDMLLQYQGPDHWF